MRIGIIGLGMVGKEVLLNLYNYSAADEILICDINQTKVKAEIEDMEDTMPHGFANHYTRMYDIASYEQLVDCDIVIINASIPAKVMTDRLALLRDNEKIMKEIATNVAKYSPNARVIITSNPVDPMAYFFVKYSGMNPAHVIGSGTTLDSVRLRRDIAKHYQVNDQDVIAWVLGEHGDSSFAAWSMARIGGFSLSDYEKMTGKAPLDKQATITEVQKRALRIYAARGYTDHGIGASVYAIFSAIAHDEKRIMAVSAHLNGEYGIKDTTLGALAIIGKNGIEKVLTAPLSDEEIALYHKSADILNSHIKSLG